MHALYRLTRESAHHYLGENVSRIPEGVGTTWLKCTSSISVEILDWCASTENYDCTTYRCTKSISSLHTGLGAKLMVVNYWGTLLLGAMVRWQCTEDRRFRPHLYLQYKLQFLWEDKVYSLYSRPDLPASPPLSDQRQLAAPCRVE